MDGVINSAETFKRISKDEEFKQKCISKNIIESFLNNNPNYKIRNVTISKNTYTIL